MIYLDNGATTKPRKEVVEEYIKNCEEGFFNPSAVYSSAFNLSKKIDEVRNLIIKVLSGSEYKDKVIFTSGATEANNLAIFGSATNRTKKYLFSVGEHPSVYNCAQELLTRGYNIQFIPLSRSGEIDYDELEKLCDKDTCFVSTMFVNNETGAVNDLIKIRQIIDMKNPNCIFHVDAVQGFCKLPLSTKKAKINLLSMSAHKIGGLKGVGALFISSGINLKNISFGGGQEKGLRSGTVNAGGIIAMGVAVRIAHSEMQSNFEKVQKLKILLLENLHKNFKDRCVCASTKNCSPYVLSLMFKGIKGEVLMRKLDVKNVIVGTGSACSASKVGNRVLESMGYTKDQITGAIRVSFGFENCENDVKIFCEKLKECLES
jgi:cysteine desulfurase